MHILILIPLLYLFLFISALLFIIFIKIGIISFNLFLPNIDGIVSLILPNTHDIVYA